VPGAELARGAFTRSPQAWPPSCTRGPDRAAGQPLTNPARPPASR